MLYVIRVSCSALPTGRLTLQLRVLFQRLDLSFSRRGGLRFKHLVGGGGGLSVRRVSHRNPRMPRTCSNEGAGCVA